MILVIKKHKKYFPRTLEELKEICDKGVSLQEIEPPKNLMSIRGLFKDSPRNEEDFKGIEEWGLEQVIDGTAGFENSNFSGKVDMQNAKYLDYSFANATRCQLPKINLRKVKTIKNTLLNVSLEIEKNPCFFSAINANSNTLTFSN